MKKDVLWKIYIGYLHYKFWGCNLLILEAIMSVITQYVHVSLIGLGLISLVPEYSFLPQLFFRIIS